MAEQSDLLPLVRRYFEQDVAGAAQSLELMEEDAALDVLKALPAPLAVRAVKHLQVSYVAALLKDAGPDLFHRQQAFQKISEGGFRHAIYHRGLFGMKRRRSSGALPRKILIDC